MQTTERRRVTTMSECNDALMGWSRCDEAAWHYLVSVRDTAHWTAQMVLYVSDLLAAGAGHMLADAFREHPLAMAQLLELAPTMSVGDPLFRIPSLTARQCQKRILRGKALPDGIHIRDQTRLGEEAVVVDCERGQACAACGVTETAAGRVFLCCGRCRSVRYCGKRCQKNDWRSGHNQRCLAGTQTHTPAPPKTT
jgi:hypothetical protein